jgi:cytochrome c oxidase subunit III
MAGANQEGGMTAASARVLTPIEHREPLPLDNRRGSVAMMLFIATEASLFILMFASYWYMGNGNVVWPQDAPPKLHYVLPMLGILILSSIVLHWGENQNKKRSYSAALAALAGTIALGLLFLGLSVLDYKEHLQTLSPRTDAYGSIFYTIITLHAAHVMFGLCMLLYVLILPGEDPRDRSPHFAYHNAAMYWHFVDVVWVFVVAILYVIPNL